MNDDDSEEEESIQLNALPLSLSQIMSLSKTAVNNAMEVAVQSSNTVKDLIQSSSGPSQPQSRVTRGSYADPSSSGTSVRGRSGTGNTVSSDSLENSML